MSSLYRRGSDARWVAQVEAPRTPDGKRRYMRAVRRTRKEAAAALRELEAAVEAGVRPEHSTMSTFLDHWIKDVLPGTVTESTATKYAWVVDHWITPHIGTVKLSKLRPHDVQRMLAALTARKKLSPRSLAQARTVLRRALRYAEQIGAVQRNVAALVDGPKLTKAPSDALTTDEARLVLAQAAGDRLEALAVLALRLGLRRGELLALRWRDVDLEAGTLTVAASKSEAGRRTLPLVADTLGALKRHGPGPADQLVFTHEDGRPIGGRDALRWWHALTEAAGIGRRRFHATRHTTATVLLEDGVPLEVVSKVLGHSGIGITADTYAEVSANALRRALSRLDAT